MIRTLLIGASLGFALALAFTVAWQPERSATAAPAVQDHARPGSRPVDRTIAADDDRARDRDRTRGPREVTPDLIERVIEVARRIDPPMAVELRALCDDHPERLEHALRTTARRFVALADLQVRDPELYETKIQELETEAEIERIARQLVAARQSSDESRIAVLEEQLQTQVRFHIALTIKSRGDSIRRLEEHIQALRRELDQYAGNFDVNVRNRIKQAIEDAEREHEAAVARSR